ncbi:chemotaxis protein CheY [Rhodococcus ruber Chol-4]|nr:chemotaxis protein CheY [Rhodococcus ruber Chol-4]MBD8057191.1 response regulator [Rhodococcus ruber]MCF8785940.1 response regulator [Rhodococcus ruber]MDO1479681.1 response regulator [Rhodococcus ruber]RQM35562.1 two-component system response regulator [Rhodococcus ruber]
MGAAAAGVPAPRTTTGSLDVLLVEDDAGDELIIRESFEANEIGSTLHVVRDGAEALDFLYRRGMHADAARPALVLLDLNLPKYDGWQVLEAVKADPDLASIPVVVLTTSTAEEDVVRSYRLRANAYVSKSVDFDRFVATVRQIDRFFVHMVRLPGR